MKRTSEQDRMSSYLIQLNPRIRLFLVIGGPVLIHLSLGTYHTFGNLLPYIASYMRNCSDSSVTLEKLVWIPTFQGCFPFSMVIGGYLSNRVGPRLAAAFGCFLMSAGVFCSAWTIRHSFWSFLFTYGLMFGFGQGIAYVIAVSCVINWAPQKIGLGSGIVTAAFSVSSSIFAPIQTHLINHENFAATKDGYFTNQEMLERVPPVFTRLAVIYFLMQLIGLVVICDPPVKFEHEHLRDATSMDMTCLFERSCFLSQNEGRPSFVNHSYARLLTDHESTELTSANRSVSCTNRLLNRASTYTDSDESSNEELSLSCKPSSIKPSTVLRSRTFYWLFALLFCCSFYGNFFYNLYKTFGETFIQDDYFLAWAFSVGSVVNALARIGWGQLTDKVGFRPTLSLATFCAALLLFTMPLTVHMGRLTYLLWLVAIFGCMGASNALFIIAVVRYFGAQYKTINYGFLTVATTLSGITLTIGCQFLLQTIGYSRAFVLTAVFPLTACLLTTTVRPSGNVV